MANRQQIIKSLVIFFRSKICKVNREYNVYHDVIVEIKKQSGIFIKLLLISYK